MTRASFATSLLPCGGLETVRSHSMIATRHGAYVVYVHTAEAPSDAEWDLALRFYQAADMSHLRTLVYTDGAAPNAAQRARLNTVLGGSRLPMAVLTPSVLARAAGTAISWFNPNFRAFGPGDYEAAFQHLSTTTEDRAALRGLIERLKGELGVRRSAVAQQRSR